MRWAMLGLMAVAVGASGCGDGGAGGAGKDRVRVYSSFSLPSENGLLRAMQLALADAGGRAGSVGVELVPLTVPPGGPTAAVLDRVEANADRAAGDPRAVAYVGESNSDQTARSITRTNQAGLLHVSPSSTYTGFTKSIGAQAGEPAKFRSSGKLTFGRVIPADDVQAAGVAEAIRRERVDEVVILDDATTYGTGLSALVRAASADIGITVSERPELDRAALDGPAALAKAMRAQRVGAVAYLGCISASVATAFFEAGPELLLFTGDCQTKPDFFEALEDPQGSMRIVAPYVDTDADAARSFIERFRARFGLPPEPQAFFAYEAMAVVLDSIAGAGADAADRDAVRAQFFATRDRQAMIGRYSIDAAGDTTLRSVGLFRVRGHKLALDELIKIG